MKFLKVIISIVLFCIIISFLIPSTVHVERSTLINAPVEVVFGQVNNLRNWNNWSPWFKKDPNVKISYKGSGIGKGASYKWVSENPDVGMGSLEILESIPNQFIKNKLLFDGENAPAYGVWSFQETNNGTKVIWGLDADMGSNPISKYFGLFMDMMVGPDFEKGLEAIKVYCEK